MGKSCFAVGCTNRSRKGLVFSFIDRFSEDAVRREQWVSVVGHKNWNPTQYSWICSAHFVSGSKNSDLLSPDYVPSIFDQS